MNYFDVEAELMLNPTLLGERERTYRSGRDWAMGVVDSDLGKYLRKLYQISTNNVNKLSRPCWHDHITIVRGEDAPIRTKFAKWSGQKIQCRIFLDVQTNGFYWWLPVVSEAAHVFRSDIGLCREPEVPLHLSFGHYIEGEIYNGERIERLERGD